MKLQCTKKLLDRMKIDYADAKKAGEASAVGGFYNWQANIVNVGRRKALIFVNCMTRITVIVYRPKPAAYKKPEAVLEEGIRELFAGLGVHDDVTEQYIRNGGPEVIASSGTRSEIAQMNKMTDEVHWHSQFFDEERVLQTTAAIEMAERPYSDGGKYLAPKEVLWNELCRMMGLPETAWDQVRSVRGYRLKVQLDLEKYDIYRVIEAPAEARVWQLHAAIQAAFGWFGYHLHSFTLYDGEVAARQRRMYYGKKRQMVIVDHRVPDSAEYYDSEDLEIRTDRTLTLRDIFEKRDSCVYSYDFGDDWEHVITVEERLNHASGHFQLLEAKGERPPEDVGGEGGFEEYMRIISDESDPEHEELLRWAEGTKAEEKTVEEINRSLGYLV